jgi:hypothetical protein
VRVLVDLDDQLVLRPVTVDGERPEWRVGQRLRESVVVEEAEKPALEAASCEGLARDTPERGGATLASVSVCECLDLLLRRQAPVAAMSKSVRSTVVTRRPSRLVTCCR